MSEQDTGTEAIISDEVVLDEIPEGIDDPQVLREQLSKEAQARRQLTARAIKAENELKELKPLVERQKEVVSTATDDALWEVADYIREGYTRQDVDFIARNGGRKALEDPKSHVSIALASMKAQRKAESEASKTSDKTQMSEAERKYTPQQLRSMTAAELKKILPKA